MGITDFGLTPSFGTYSYSTDRFEGSAELNALSTYGPQFDLYSLTFQLNVVVVLTHGSQSASYWIQDVPYLNTSTQDIVFIDNVWNLTSPTLSFPANSIQGNGSVNQLGNNEGFYGDEADPALPGNNVHLAYPTNLSAEVVASTISGLTHVGFEYNDGYGWRIFDNVTFPWTSGWTSRGFLVDGAVNPPAGAYYDAEWVLCGPGSGSSTIDEASNLTLELMYHNGHNFETVPNAFNFGADTAETISNVVDTLPSAASGGAPVGVVRAGSGTVTSLYGRSDYAVLNATGIPNSGVLSVDGAPTNYSGGSLNVTLLSGPSRLDLQTSSGSDAVNFTAGPSEYFRTVGLWTPISLSPTRALPTTLVTATGHPLAVGLDYAIEWYPGGAPVCATQIPSNGSLLCSFDVPLIVSGWYGIAAINGTSTSATGFGSFFVRSNLTEAVRSSVPWNDAGFPFTFIAQRTGGSAPFSPYHWDFGDGAQEPSVGNNVSHSFRSAGSFTVTAVVSDALGNTASSSTNVTVVADPSVFTPTSNRTSADVGQSVTFSAYYTPGSGSDQFLWLGLPAGCGGTAATVSCSGLPYPANLSVSVSVTDAAGFMVHSGALIFDVFSPPLLGAPHANRTSLDVGQRVSFSANVSRPGSGIARLSWSLDEPQPIGFACAPTPVGAYDCKASASGSYSVRLSAVDSNGAVGNATSLPIAVLSDPTVSPPGFRPPIGDVGVPMNGSVFASSGSGGYRYVWGGLPGCASGNASIRCAPTLQGTFNVTVTVVDSNGYAVTSPITPVAINPPMVVTVVHPIGPQTAGAPLSFSTSVTGGTTPYESTWEFGDGVGAAGSDVGHSYPSAGAYGVQVWVNDTAGGTVYREFAVLVDRPSTGFTLASLETDLPYFGALAALLVGVALALAWRPRKPVAPPLTRRSTGERHNPPPARPVRPPSWDDPTGWD